MITSTALIGVLPSGGQMLSAMVGQSTEGSLDERIVSAVASARESRERQYGKGPFLIFRRDGDIEPFPLTRSRELPSCIICFDAIDQDTFNSITDAELRTAIAALSLAADSFLGATRVASGLVFFREDGKAVYSYTFTGSATAHVSRPLPSTASDDSQSWFSKLSTDSSLERVLRLLVGSWETGHDPLRSFSAAWNALEIFINKTFADYEHEFLEGLTSPPSAARSHFLETVRLVMKDKYRLVDKFALIASVLAPVEADADLRILKSLKKQRDAILHGQDVDERLFKVTDAHQLLRKYLRLHLSRTRAA